MSSTPIDENPDADRTIRSGDDLETIGSDRPLAASGAPPTIPGYELLGQLGAGGMGVVWEAEQQSPRRRVALKVIRGHFIDDLQIRLFQREADTLARLKHPDIGAIYESGRTSAGQHFFAMELVRGNTLGEYLTQRAPSGVLSPEEVRYRLELFRRITDAVHYAHQRGVIHRDLKPSNVVVGERSESGSSSARIGPDVKILDFGLARITDTDVQASMVSEVGVIKGTLAYMSPEQARGNPDEIDVRTDVYSLGVILYEMLAARLPKDLPTGSMLDALRVVTEQRPRPLSEAFRGTRGLDTDVATICHKALELAPEDRYASAAALSEDVGRWLSDLPIQARPPSTMYQLRKFVARKKAMSAFVGTVALLLVGLAVTMSVLRGEAERARGEAQAAVDRLEVAHADLETVVDFQARMLSDLDAETFGRNLFQGLRTRLSDALEGEPDRDAALASIDSRLQLLNPTDVALGVLDDEILTRAEEAVAAEFAERPEVRGRLEQSLGRTAFELGLYERAQRLTQRAIDSFEESGAAASAVVARTGLAEVELYDSEFESAASEIERAIEDGRRVLGPEHPDVVRAVTVEALLYREMGEYAKSESLYVVAADAFSRVLGPEAEETLMAREGVAYNASYQDRLEEAEAAYAELVPAAQRAFGNEDIRTQDFVHDAAQNYVRMERYDEALELYLGALEVGRRIQGSDHSETHVSIVNIGRLFSRAGRYEEAETYGRQALEIAERTMAPVSMPAAMSYAVIGDALQGQGRDAEAEAPLTKAYEIFCAVLGPASGGAIVMARMLRDGMESRGKAKEAEVWAARAETKPAE